MTNLTSPVSGLWTPQLDSRSAWDTAWQYKGVRGDDGTYRVFYFPHGKGVCVLGHGFSKKTSKCPPAEVKRAEKMRKRFVADPVAHTYEEQSDGNKKDN